MRGSAGSGVCLELTKSQLQAARSVPTGRGLRGGLRRERRLPQVQHRRRLPVRVQERLLRQRHFLLGESPVERGHSGRAWLRSFRRCLLLDQTVKS